MYSSIGSRKSNPESTVVTLNVGGEIFQTTQQTLTQAGPNSFLSSISSSSTPNPDIPFIDRDPELFSIILSLLRTGNLPSKSPDFDLQALISESQFYGIEPILIKSVTDPSQFNPLHLQKSLLLPLNGRDTPSAISTTSLGSVHVAHGSKITSFDWSLTRKSTILTHFVAIDSLLAVNPGVAAAGATDFCGLQIIDLEKGFVRETLNWENLTKSSSNVEAIGSSNEYLFTSFESSRRNSNAIVVYDLLGDFRPVYEIARNEIYGADFDCSTIPATKLSWVSTYNLLMASGSHSGPTGVVGSIKLWDVRSGNAVWEMKEKVDCFADVAVSSSLSCLFKVGVNSGEVFFLDLRNLGPESEWVCLGNRTKLINSKKEGLGCKVECHGSDVFVSKGGDLELWSEVLVSSSCRSENVLDDRVFKRTLMGRAKDMGGEKINNFRFGGNKLFVTRKYQQLVEVWRGATGLITMEDGMVSSTMTTEASDFCNSNSTTKGPTLLKDITRKPSFLQDSKGLFVNKMVNGKPTAQICIYHGRNCLGTFRTDTMRLLLMMHIDHGGLGIYSTRLSFPNKTGWRVLTEPNSLWARVLR